MHMCVDWPSGIPWFGGCFLPVAFGIPSGRTSVVPGDENGETQPIDREGATQRPRRLGDFWGQLGQTT